MDFFQLWDQILDYIDQYDHPYYDMFSNEVFPISMTENTLTISPKNKRRKPWIENVYKGKLEKIIFDITGKQLSIEISDIMNQPAEPAQMPPMPEPVPLKSRRRARRPSRWLMRQPMPPMKIRLRLSRSLISMIPFRRKPCRRIFPS